MGCLGSSTRENINFEELAKQREKEKERIIKQLDEQRKIEEKKLIEIWKK